MPRADPPTCHRCGAAIDSVQNDLPNRLLRFDKSHHGSPIDLCTECAQEFKAWLDDSTPLGCHCAELRSLATCIEGGPLCHDDTCQFTGKCILQEAGRLV